MSEIHRQIYHTVGERVKVAATLAKRRLMQKNGGGFISLKFSKFHN